MPPEPLLVVPGAYCSVQALQNRQSPAFRPLLLTKPVRWLHLRERHTAQAAPPHSTWTVGEERRVPRCR